MPYEISETNVKHLNDMGKVDAELRFTLPGESTLFRITNSFFAQKMQGARVQQKLMEMIMDKLRQNFWPVVNRVIDVPYRNGGINLATGFDATGLNIYFYNHVYGLSLPGDITKQIDIFNEVPAEQAILGDMLVWGGKMMPTSVGIYIGGGRYITADLMTGKVVQRTIDYNWQPDMVLSVRLWGRHNGIYEGTGSTIS